MRMPGILVAILGVGCGRLFGIGDVPGVTDASPTPQDSDGVARRKPITIHGAMIPGAETDFPVWIALDDGDLAARARADGSDIFFTDATGAALDHEIQRWLAPKLSAWVRIPALTANTDTTIYVVYGDTSRAAPPNPPGVFRSSFAAVWHLDDTAAIATIADATGAHPGTAVGLAVDTRVVGQLGNGIAFDGTGAGVINFTNPLLGSTPHTISAWVDQQPVTHTSAIVTVGTPATDQSRVLYGRYGNGVTLGVGYYNDDIVPDLDLGDGKWTLIHWTLEGTRANHIYTNGVDATTANTASTPSTAGTAGAIGFAPEPDYGVSNGFLGVIDEVRIATVARDSSWIRIEYENQASPQTFYAVGAEEIAQ
jgi:hypothetical protein